MPDIRDLLPVPPWEGPPVPRFFPSPFGLTDDEVAEIKSQIREIINREGLPKPTGIFIVGSFARGNAWIGSSDLDVIFFFPELKTFKELSDVDDKYWSFSSLFREIARKYGAKDIDILVTNTLEDSSGRGIERAAEGYRTIRR